jgi:2-dehydropantoate 2-reductase
VGARVGVFGAGAIGSIVGGYLSRAGTDVVLVDQWFHHLDRISRSGLTVTAIEEEFVAHPRIAHLDELPTVGMFDLVVIATKSYDTRWMATLAAPHLLPDGLAISAQNGMNEAALTEVFGAERTVGCVVPMAAELPAPAAVRRTSGQEWGTLALGELDGAGSARVERAAAALAALDVEVSPDIRAAIWGKLTLNVMSNGLGGLTGYTTHRLWSDDTVLDVAVALAHELALVAAREGVTPAPVLGTIDHALLRDARHVGDAAWGEVKDRMRAVAATRTGDKENKPSLLQDMEKGRRTEIDYLNGWVVGAAAGAGLEAPVNAALVTAVRDKEAGVGGTGADPHLPLTALARDLYRA